MYKKYLAVLAVLLLCTTVGCGKAGSSDMTTDGSAVDYSTADSDTGGYKKNAEVPDIEESTEENVEEDVEEDEEALFYEDAEIICELPKGFKAVSGESGYYTTRNYPNDIANIDYMISESDIDVSALDEHEFKKEIEADIYALYGDKVNVDIHKFEKIKIDGRSGLRVHMSYEVRGTAFEQLEYLVYNGKESHIITYTQEKGGKWMEQFEESGNSIAFIQSDAEQLE